MLPGGSAPRSAELAIQPALTPRACAEPRPAISADGLAAPHLSGSAQFSLSSAPAPARPPQTPASSPSGPSARVSTLDALSRALSDPSVSLITLSAHLRLSGAPLLLPPNRPRLSLQGDPSACAAAPGRPSGPIFDALPPGLCFLDAAGASRVLELSRGAAVDLSGLALVNGRALAGGAVLATAAQVSAAGCAFANCTAVGDGGALLALAGATATLSGCSVVSSRSLLGTGGGAAALFGSSLALSGGSFVQDCSAALGGGAAAAHGSTLTLDGASALRGCAAGFGGGAAALNGSSAVLRAGSAVEGASADGDGGCAFAWRLSNLTVSDSTLRGCAAGGSGGGVSALYSESVRLERASVLGCAAGASGGGLHLRHSAGALVDSDVSSNAAPAGSGGGFAVVGGVRGQPWCAGRAACATASLACSGSTLRNNSCGRSGGGGVVYRSGALTSSGCAFLGGRAGDAGGGLVVDSLGQDLALTNASFVANEANSCGAIHVLNPDAFSMADSRLEGNRATLNVVVEHGNGEGVFGEGGAACVTQSPEVQTRYTCVSGQGGAILAPFGFLSAVAPGYLILGSEPFDCRWVLAAPAGCAVELTLSAVYADREESVRSSLSVLDATSGRRVLSAVNGRLLPSSSAAANGTAAAAAITAAPSLPVVLTSSGPAGLTVDFAVESEGDDGFFETGFLASFRRVCGSGGAGGGASAANNLYRYGRAYEMRLRNVTFSNNAGAGHGGGMFLDSGTWRRGVVTLDGVRFEGNTAREGGGGLAAFSSLDVTATDCAWVGNTALGGGVDCQGGGLLVMSEAGSAVLRNATFEGNAALSPTDTGGGGGAAFFGANASLLFSRVLSNSAQGDGGGLLFSGGTRLLVAGSTLAGNSITAGSRGGALAAINARNVTLSYSSLANNTVSLAGAAAAVSEAATVVTRFLSGEGGAAFLAVGPGQKPLAGFLIACEVSGNRAPRFGGGVSLWGAQATRIIGSSLLSNAADIGGGGVAVGAGATLNLQGSELAGNLAAGDAASAASFDPLLADLGSASVDGAAKQCAQDASRAVGENPGGGGVWAARGAVANVLGSAFSRNGAADGGGAFALQDGSSASLTSCTLEENFADVGGAFYMSGAARLSVSGGSVTGSRAFYGGVFGFTREAERRSAINTSSAPTFDGNRAVAGGFAAVADDGDQFSAPPCDSCLGDLGLGLSYGVFLATVPSDASVAAAPTLRTGSSAAAAVRLFDGFLQPVLSFPSALASVSLAAASSADCAAGAALAGAQQQPYARGAFNFSSLLVLGPPGCTLTLRVKLDTLGSRPLALRPSALDLLHWNVTVDPCRRLEQYSAASRLCACVPGAEPASAPATLGCNCREGFALSAFGAVCSPVAAAASSTPRWVVGVAAGVSSFGFLLILALLRWAIVNLVRTNTYRNLLIKLAALVPVIEGGSGAHANGGATAVGAAAGDPAAAAADLLGTDRDLLDCSHVMYQGTRVALKVIPQPRKGGSRTSGGRTSVIAEIKRRASTAVRIGAGKSIRGSLGSDPEDWQSAHSGTAGAGRSTRSGGGAGGDASSTVDDDASSVTASSVANTIPFPPPLRPEQQRQDPRLRVTNTGSVASASEVSFSLPPTSEAGGRTSATGAGTSFAGGRRIPPRRGSNTGTDATTHRERRSADRGADGRSLASRRSNTSGGSSSVRRCLGGASRMGRWNWARSNLLEIAALRHPNIVTVFGASVVDDGVPVLVQEHMACGELASLLDLNRAVEADFKAAAKIAQDVAAGCAFLHAAATPVVVRLSPETVLVDGNLNAKIQLRPVLRGYEEPTLPDERAAPEVLAGGVWTPESDVYAFAFILLDLFCGASRRPFAALREEKGAAHVMERVLQGDLRPDIPDGFLPPLRDLICDCWHRNPARRPPFAEVAQLLQRAIEQSLPAVNAARAADQELLRQVLPPKVAEALKAGRKVEPETYNPVTIFFSCAALCYTAPASPPGFRLFLCGLKGCAWRREGDALA